MQRYVFVDNISKVLISTFKSKQFEMNKREIHTEVMYRRIFEYERFRPVVNSFVDKLKKSKQDKYIYILRKICLIDGNPLPLIQREIYKLLYEGEVGSHIYSIGYDDCNTIVIIKNHDDGETEEIDGHTFSSSFNIEESNYILDQLCLEADLCYGRNKY